MRRFRVSFSYAGWHRLHNSGHLNRAWSRKRSRKFHVHATPKATMKMRMPLATCSLTAKTRETISSKVVLMQ